MNPQIESHVLYTEQEVRAAVDRLAGEIAVEYSGKCPLLVGVLKGGFVFMADLIRLLDFPLEVDFVTLSSYGRGRHTPGELKVVGDLACGVEGRHVLVVEDIVDTGRTISLFMDRLRKDKPASLKLAALLDKPSRREMPVSIDYLGFTVPDRFIVGYGIDWDERYRNLADIRYVEVR